MKGLLFCGIILIILHYNINYGIKLISTFNTMISHEFIFMYLKNSQFTFLLNDWLSFSVPARLHSPKSIVPNLIQFNSILITKKLLKFKKKNNN